MKRTINPVPRRFKLRRSYNMYLVPLIFFITLATCIALEKQPFFDVPIMHVLGNLRTTEATNVFKFITDLGSVPVVIVTVIALAGALVFRRKHFELMIIAAGVLGAGAIGAALKIIFGRVRPDYLSHLVVESGKSFPSGHSIMSSALALSIIYLLWPTKWRYLTLVMGIIYIFLVGVSRVYLGVHYPSDVIAGWSVSWLWVGLIAHWFVSSPRRRDRVNRV